MPVAPTESPTKVRFGVLAFTVAMAVLLYLDRFCITPVTAVMIDELDVTKEQFGRAVGAFFFAYALMQVPAGWLADRRGGRLSMSLFVAAWSLATIGIAFAQTLTLLLVMRLALGVAQAGAYPTAAAVNRVWVPLRNRAAANSAVSSGGRAGALLAFAATPVLMLAAADLFGATRGAWRFIFVFYGLLGLVWSGLFGFWFRNTPRQHPACNDAEARLIEEDTEGAAPHGERLSVAVFLRSRNVWALSLINFLMNIAWIFLATWLPTCLLDRHGAELGNRLSTPQAVAGMLTAMIGLMGIMGNLTGGFLSDWLLRRVGRQWARRTPGLITGVGGGVVYLLAAVTADPWLFIAAMAAISFLIDLSAGGLWAAYQEIGSKNTAVVLGFANMCGNLGAAGCSWMIGYLADRNQWSLVFLVSAGSLLALAVTWLSVDATRPIAADTAHLPVRQ